jgi:hypothetical protein
MIQNEIDFCRKIVDLADAIKFHTYSVPAVTKSKLNPKGKKAKQKVFPAYRAILQPDGLTLLPQQYRNENVLEHAYALQYRNCPADTSESRAIYGSDIRLEVRKKKEIWVRNLETPLLNSIVSSELRTIKNALALSSKRILEFYQKRMDEFTNRDQNGNTLDDNEDIVCGIFLHIDCSILGYEHWYEIPGVLSASDTAEIMRITNEVGEKKKEAAFLAVPGEECYSLVKSLLNTVASGDESSDNQFQDFDLAARHKSFSLTSDDRRIVAFYWSKTMNMLRVSIPKTKGEYFFRVVPCGDFSPMNAQMFIDNQKAFRGKFDTQEKAESGVSEEDDNIEIMPDEPIDGYDKKIYNMAQQAPSGITSFDITLMHRESHGQTNVSELSRLYRSSFCRQLKRIEAVSEEVTKKYKCTWEPQIWSALNTIYSRCEKRYLNIIGQIFMKLWSGSYRGIASLKELFIDGIQYNIRNSEGPGEYALRVAYLFLKKLNTTEEQMDEKSYRLGELCAEFCWPLIYQIGSFDKQYSGYITRKVKSVDEVTEFIVFSEGKLILHAGEMMYATGKGGQFPIGVVPDTSYYALEARKLIKEGIEKFDALSFADGYYFMRGNKLYTSKKGGQSEESRG